MSPTGPITITLPATMSERIREKIANSGYVDPLDVIGEGLDALESGDGDLSAWMSRDIMEACDELDHDPTAVITLDELGEELKAEYARALKAG